MESDGINRYEELCLRWARGALIATIALGCLAIVGGLVVAGAAWLWPGPRRPSAPAAFEPTTYDLKMAEKWAREHASEAREIEQAALTVGDPGRIPPPLAPLFPTPPYAANDVWETYCKAPTDYGCLEKGKRLTTPSASRTFAVMFHDVEEQTREDLTKVLAVQLPKVSVEKRLQMVAPILLSYVALRKENNEGASAQATKAKETEQAYEAEAESQRNGKLAISGISLYAAAWGFGAVLSASVFVALLAIERHLRAIRSGSRQSASSSSIAA